MAMSIRAGGVAEGATASPGPAAKALERVEAYLRRATTVIERHEPLLDRLDVALGDGDHGSNMTMGLRTIVRTLDEMPAEARPSDVGAMLRFIGHGLVASVGGASGPLYGTAFLEAGFLLSDRDRLDTATVADAFEVAARALARRGRCEVGDKTILDALEPAARVFRMSAERGDPMEVAVRAAIGAAAAGMKATIPLVARRGLALRLGERSRGHRDPGATSCFLLMRAMAPPAGAAPVGPIGYRASGDRAGRQGA
jgi:dihydroxyacetone kinase-like protein